MTLAFKAQVTSAQKLVLLALCDCANDQGECYPSVPTLEQKCSMSDRSVQRAITELEAGGYLTRTMRTGRATLYLMKPDPRHSVTPDKVSPPTRRHPTPDTVSPPPPTQCHPTPDKVSPRTIKEPSVEPSRKQIAASVQAPTPPAPFLGDENIEAMNGRHVAPLADRWELPLQWGIDSEALGWKPGEVLKESEKFRQYWTSGKGAGTRRSVKGWRQSWSNWLSNAERYKR